jgi:hypothetical protein
MAVAAAAEAEDAAAGDAAAAEAEAAAALEAAAAAAAVVAEAVACPGEVATTARLGVKARVNDSHCAPMVTRPPGLRL